MELFSIQFLGFFQLSAMKLIGYAFLSGRIDFTREVNPWAFQRIDAGMKQSQKDRIRVDPTKAPIELRSAEINGEEIPPWMESMERILRSAESMYLQYKSGVLRFRRANHPAGQNKTYVTLGNQDEVDLYASENWMKIRYLYAKRRPGAFCFDVNTLISHKEGFAETTRRIELPARLDLFHPSGDPQFTFDSSGQNASVEIINFRKVVKEGETKRYQPENSHLEINCKGVTRPFTFLHEVRTEFNNHSYTFSGDKMSKLERVVTKRLAQIEKERGEQSAEPGDSQE